MENNNIAFIGLGSNIGDRLSFLGKGILYLTQVSGVHVLSISSVYETDPVGYLEQAPFYNMAIKISTNVPANQLLQYLLSIERQLGRERTIKNGPRTLDLDLLFYGDQSYEEEDLVLPHPRLVDRAFVLAPLVEIAPDFIHPLEGKTITELWLAVNRAGVRKLAFTHNTDKIVRIKGTNY